MKAGWQVQPLQSFCNEFKQDIVDGPFGSELQRKDYIDEGIPVLKIQNVKPFAVEFKKMDYVSSTKFHELRRHSYKTGDIVMTKLGAPLGAAAIVREGTDGVIVADLVRIRAQRINTEYLCYHLNSPGTSAFINSMQKGTTRPRVTLSVVRELPIAVPSTSEQQRIVAILDEAFSGIATSKANAEKNLQNARDIFDSHLQAVFTERGEGWVQKCLDEVGTTQTGSTPKTDDRENYGSFIPFVKPGDFNKDGSLSYEGDGLSEKGSEGARKVTAGSVLMVCIGATIGKCGFCERDVTTNQQINAFTPAANLSHKLIYYQMRTENFQRRILNSSAQATLPIINKSKWSALTVSFPRDVAEQNRIVGRLDLLLLETQRLESIYLQKLAALDELKKSLLHQAFNGNL